jgi:hypothetical protein
VNDVSQYEVEFQLDSWQGARQFIAPVLMDLRLSSFPFFKASFIPAVSGTYDVRITVRRPGTGGAGNFVPFEVILTEAPLVVTAGEIHMARSSASGPGLVSPVTAAEEVSFLIQTKDAAGNPMGRGGYSFDIVVHATNTEATGGRSFRVDSVVDMGDGTYNVTYTAKVAGEYHVQITRGNELLEGSEVAYPVTVAPGETAAVNSFAFPEEALVLAEAGVQSTFRVVAQDIAGNRQPTFTDTFLYSVSG